MKISKANLCCSTCLCILGILYFSCIIATNNGEEIKLLNANLAEYSYDKVIFSGDVDILYDQKKISADTVEYIQDSKKINAFGNVKIKETNGNVLHSDSVKIDTIKKEAEISGSKLRLLDNTHINAKHALIRDKEYFNMQDIDYSPCYNCIIGDRLTWEIKASSVKQSKEDISYKDAKFYFLGTPIVYLPYFSHPSFHVERRSGFLTPLIMHDTIAGMSLIPRYLVSISKSQELIFKPVITSKIGPVAWTSYSIRFPNGLFTIDSSITGTKSVEHVKGDISSYEKHEIKKIKSNKYRGHIFTNFRYDINREFRLKSNINLVSDKYYLKKMPFLNDFDRRLLTSDISIERFLTKEYTSLQTMYFQTLKPEDTTDDIPLALPIFSHHASYDIFDGSVDFDVFASRLNFHGEHSVNKSFANIGYSKSLVNGYGIVADITVKCLTSFNRASCGNSEKTSNSINEISPLGSMIVKWPLEALLTKDLSLIIEPCIGAVLVDNKKRDMSVIFDKYTSMKLFELDDSNFLEAIRNSFSGNIDDGSRIPYGLKLSSYFNSENIANFTVGRSISLSKSNFQSNDSSDINRKSSNIIFKLELFPNRNTSIFASGSYDRHKDDFKRFECGAIGKYKVLNVKISSFSAKKNGQNNGTSTNCGIHSVFEIKIRDDISCNYSCILGGSKNKLLKNSIGISYKNECFSADLILSKTNFKSADIKPTKSITLLFSFKNLGNSRVNM